MTIPIESADTYTDFQGLAELKLAAKKNSPEALRAVAEQFEALFIQQMLKGMRNIDLGDGMLDSNAGDMYQDMFDKQLSLNLSQGKGIGIADMLVKKLSGALGVIEKINNISEHAIQPQNSALTITAIKPVNKSNAVVENIPDKVKLEITGSESFVKNLWPLAVKAGNELGVDPKVILAQAALETGWGSAIQKAPNGVSSHNLFNIKAGSKWTGSTINTNTNEVINNKLVKENAYFRVYDSYADSFTDYVDLLKNNSRYYNVLKQADGNFSYIKGLQDAGYATDPRYAEKIMRIVESNKIENSLTDLKLSLRRPITK